MKRNKFYARVFFYIIIRYYLIFDRINNFKEKNSNHNNSFEFIRFDRYLLPIFVFKKYSMVISINS